MKMYGLRIHVTGIVQGVGFRPFVYSMAMRNNLKGWVRNTSAGVDIEVDGPAENLRSFVYALNHEAPSLAQVDEVLTESCLPNGFTSFEIIKSEPIPDAFIPISPDVSICPDCLRELLDPGDRRYHYPFINCTNCGPRFTIIEDIPYDRPFTTMKDFTMCPACSQEYHDPNNRRFHAQPVACPDCGPQVWLEENKIRDEIACSADNAIHAARERLLEGKILAIKGLGGYHLACDALNGQAVATLRKRKLRVDKPFALMMPDIETVSRHCILNTQERALLESRERPIVILDRKTVSSISEDVAPHQNTLGVMLPYTPLHYLLFSLENGAKTSNHLSVLVMTSGNLSEEPIVFENDAARQQLVNLADAYLMHNRPIRLRCDDSVVRVFKSSIPTPTKPYANQVIIRRSRGFAPAPVKLPWRGASGLATGAELKNTICLTRENYALISQHIGDLENYETLQSFEDSITHLEKLFRVKPEAIFHDLHPNYLSTRYALERASYEHIPALGVQHHHAHIAACMAENNLPMGKKVIGVAFDGTGYGDDGAIWGGEFLLATYGSYLRLAHLKYFPLPGGDAAIRKPARTAFAYMRSAELDCDPVLPTFVALCSEERQAIATQLSHHINTPMTSSMGRLFDIIASLTGIRQTINYEAQAAIELEALADPFETREYPFDIKCQYVNKNDTDRSPVDKKHALFGSITIDPKPVIESVVADYYANTPTSIISARFHNGIVSMVCQVVRVIREQSNTDQVALSGGVWQNSRLFTKTVTRLEQDGFTVFTHHQVPPNDGGISLGQAVVGLSYLADQDLPGGSDNRVTNMGDRSCV